MHHSCHHHLHHDHHYHYHYHLNHYHYHYHCHFHYCMIIDKASIQSGEKKTEKNKE